MRAGHTRIAAMVGIEYRDTDAFIDEIPAAYKPIDQVMADAADRVRVRHAETARQRKERLERWMPARCAMARRAGVLAR